LIVNQLIGGTFLLGVGTYLLLSQQTQVPAKNAKDALIRVASALAAGSGFFLIFSALDGLGFDKLALASMLIWGFAGLFIDFRRRGNKVLLAIFQALTVLMVIMIGGVLLNQYVL
jgi:hypothetical protein